MAKVDLSPASSAIYRVIAPGGLGSIETRRNDERVQHMKEIYHRYINVGFKIKDRCEGAKRMKW